MLVGLALTAILLAQRPSKPVTEESAPLVLRASTRLVMLSVIAHDKDNQPVTDLKHDDFRIKVNGKIQKVRRLLEGIRRFLGVRCHDDG